MRGKFSISTSHKTHTHLGCQALEESRGTFVPNQFFNDCQTMDLAFEIRVLYPCLHGIQRSSDRDGSNCACYWSDKVLRPRRFRVIRDTEDVFFGDRWSAEELREGNKKGEGRMSLQWMVRKRAYSEASRSVSGHCPSPAAIQCRTFLHEDSHGPATSESFWVYLSFNFQSVKG